MYICGDVFGVDDKHRCKREGVEYNQCCQDCKYVRECKNHCDYAHDYGCIVKEEVK